MDWSSRTIWNTLDSQTQNIFMKIYLWSVICINIIIICNCHLAKMALKAGGIKYFLFVTKFVLSLKYNAARKWDFFALTNCCSWKYDACSQMRSGLQLSLTIYSQATYKSDWCSYHEKMREEYVNDKCLTYANSVEIMFFYYSLSLSIRCVKRRQLMY